MSPVSSLRRPVWFTSLRSTFAAIALVLASSDCAAAFRLLALPRKAAQVLYHASCVAPACQLYCGAHSNGKCPPAPMRPAMNRSEEHTSELQSPTNLVCR